MGLTQVDEITVRDDGPKTKPHPDGQFAAICVDVVNLGDRVKSFQGKTKVSPTLALIFMTEAVGDDGKHRLLSQEFANSMFRSNLKAFLESWRGRSYTDEQLKEGVALHKLAGNPGLLSVEHRAYQGKTYANIKSISPLPKLMAPAAPSGEGYVRPDFWEERKKKYADAVAEYRRQMDRAPTDDDYIAPEFDDDDLPF